MHITEVSLYIKYEHRNSFYRNDSLAIHHKMSLIVKPIEENDAESCGKIGYQAHNHG
jgi:hypothetical protein